MSAELEYRELSILKMLFLGGKIAMYPKQFMFPTVRYIRLIVTSLALCIAALLPSTVSAEDIGPFHIKHWSSGWYIHPEFGTAKDDITAVVHPGKAAHTEFFFRRVEGKWGLIIHRKSGKILIPYGGRVDAANGTRIVFHRDAGVGAHFSIDQDKQVIEHRSGRFWHPSGGKSRPKKNTGIVVYTGHGPATKFFAVNTRNDSKLRSFLPRRNDVAGKAVGRWVAVRTGGTAKGKLNMSKSFNVGGSKEASVSQEVRNSISATIESSLSFGAGSASISVTGSRESATTEASTIAKTFDNGGQVSCEQEVDTETYDYEVMWQWQVRVTGSAHAIIATCTVACTSTSAPPKFGPGSSQQLRSCKIRRR